MSSKEKKKNASLRRLNAEKKHSSRNKKFVKFFIIHAGKTLFEGRKY